MARCTEKLTSVTLPGCLSYLGAAVVSVREKAPFSNVALVSSLSQDGSGSSEEFGKDDNPQGAGDQTHQHSWPEIHVSKLDKASSLPLKLDIFDSVQDLAESSVPHSNTGLVGMQASSIHSLQHNPGQFMFRCGVLY